MTIEFQLVPAPTQAPQCCMICKSQKGPLTDTFIETPLGRVYVCELCVSRLARAAGLIEGDRFNQLVQASATLAQAEREISQRETQIERMQQKLKDKGARIAELERDVEHKRGEIATLQHIADGIAAAAGQLQRVEVAS